MRRLVTNCNLSQSSFDVRDLETSPKELHNLLFEDIFGACMAKNINIVL
jgi:hypothetical protein